MLLSFTVQNFLSFNERQRFSMIASNYKTKTDHIFNVRNLKLLKSSIIYGANASGKTNLVKAIRFMKNVVTEDLNDTSIGWYHKNNSQNAELPSRFEVEIIVDNQVYAYGFESILKQMRITSEWLYKINPENNAEEMVYERELFGEKYITRFDISNEDDDVKRFNFIAQDLENNFETLLIREMNRNKKIDNKSNFIVFQNVFKWFTDKLEIISPDEPITNFEYVMVENNDLHKNIKSLINIFDTGITNIKSEEIELDEVIKIFPQKILNNVIHRLNSSNKTNQKKVRMMSLRDSENYYQFSKIEDDIKIRTIKMNHGDSSINFDFREESDGTRRLFDLIDILLNIDKGKVYIIDEIDRSLHPNLLYKFLELYYARSISKRIQLIFTTHESSIMDLDLVRQDEIWFIDRNNKNESNLYSLDVFKVRYDKKVDRAYLEGRYGAIPVFKNLPD